MSNFYAKLEKKLGRFAIPHLTLLIIFCYVIGYLLQAINPSVSAYMTLEPALILKGQVWRLITWIVIPPSSLDIFSVIMLFFYLSIGRILEKAWGLFRYNLYIIGGFILTVISAFLCYGVFYLVLHKSIVFGSGSSPFSTFYVCMSIFLGFAATFPDFKINLYFLIPIKVKWMGMVYVALLLWDLCRYIYYGINGNYYAWVYIAAMVASLLNFVIFFFMTTNIRRYRPSEVKRRSDFKKAMASGLGRQTNQMSGGQTLVNAEDRFAKKPRHCCAVCGKTDLTDPDMEFRYCSKCNGVYEYCMDHLYTHTHQ